MIVISGGVKMMLPTVMEETSSAIQKWAGLLEKAVKDELLATNSQDGSHDFGHLLRVSSLARRFAKEEGANELVAYTAGMLHDIVNLPKDHPDIKQCSKFAADRAEQILSDIKFPKEHILNVCHSIHAHSFTANITPQTNEARCVQDGDRMEAIGAFGLMRVFYVCGQKKSALMHDEDPVGGVTREHNDRAYALDHFVVKLFTLEGSMKTDAGRRTAHLLAGFLEDFRNSIIEDKKKGNLESGRFTVANVYREAGINKIALFHPDDPFAESRLLEPKKYALDSLLDSRDSYVNKFIEQLRFELGGYQDRV